MPGGLGGTQRKPHEIRTVVNPAYDPKKTFRTASGKQATLNPRQIAPGEYNPRGTVFGSTKPGAISPRMPSFPGMPTPSPGGGTSGWTGGATAGGTTGGLPGGAPPTVPGYDPLSIEAKPSPEMERAEAAWRERMAKLDQARTTADQNLQYHIDQYKERLGEGPTTRAIERSASAIRDQLAGLQSEAETAGAMGGRGRGFGASGLAESAQRAQAGAAADISLGRERDLDRLVLGGGGIMGAPGQREMGYSALQNQLYGMEPFSTTAGFGLAEKDLGLRSYLGQLGAQTDLARAQADMYGRPIDWFNMLYRGF